MAHQNNNHQLFHTTVAGIRFSLLSPPTDINAARAAVVFGSQAPQSISQLVTVAQLQQQQLQQQQAAEAKWKDPARTLPRACTEDENT